MMMTIMPTCEILKMARLPNRSASLPHDLREIIAPRLIAAVAATIYPSEYPRSFSSLILKGTVIIEAVT